MKRKQLAGHQRAYLMKRAHSLKPVVHVGKSGATEAVVAATVKALEDHELIKVRFVDFKDIRREIAHELEQSTESYLIQVIGNIAVFYRPRENTDEREFHVPGWYD
jgi:RNA-binding protein